MNIATKECVSQPIVGFLLDNHIGTFNQLSKFCNAVFKYINGSALDIDNLVDEALEFMIAKFKIIKIEDDIFALTLRRPYKMSPCRFYPSKCTVLECNFVHTIGEHKIARYLECHIKYFKRFSNASKNSTQIECSLFSQPTNKECENIELIKENFELSCKVERLKISLWSMRQRVSDVIHTKQTADQFMALYDDLKVSTTNIINNLIEERDQLLAEKIQMNYDDKKIGVLV